MDLTRSKTMQIVTLVTAVITAASVAAIDWRAGAVAMGVVVILGGVGFSRERGAVTGELVRVLPVPIAGLDAIVCGVEETAPSLLALTDAHDGPRLLRFVSRAEGDAVARDLGSRGGQPPRLPDTSDTREAFDASEGPSSEDRDFAAWCCQPAAVSSASFSALCLGPCPSPQSSQSDNGIGARGAIAGAGRRR